MNSQPKWDIYESVGTDFKENASSIGSGEATWLWNMDTGLEELRKLLVDYKIILQSTQLGIKSASFFSCMQAWKEYTRYIKSPASVITAKCPELMYFIGCLKDIAENGEISHEKHEKFLAELTEKASMRQDITAPKKSLQC